MKKLIGVEVRIGLPSDTDGLIPREGTVRLAVQAENREEAIQMVTQHVANFFKKEPA